MTRQDFEDFEKNAVSNFEEIEKNFMIKNEEAIRSQPISRKDRVN
jgi:chloramphenicol O-acetyltransferase